MIQLVPFGGGGGGGGGFLVVNFTGRAPDSDCPQLSLSHLYRQYRQQVAKFCQDAAKTLGTNRQNGDNGNCYWPLAEITVRATERRCLLVEVHVNKRAEETSPKMATFLAPAE